MTGPQEDGDRPAVPGLEPPDGRTRPLDMAGDPDRFDATRSTEPVFDPDEHPRVVEPTAPGGGLDPAKDPDRFRPPGQGQSLTDLLGEGAHVDGRDGYQWVAGLLGVLGFLALVAFLFQNVVRP
jgi:hypothetical protein